MKKYRVTGTVPTPLYAGPTFVHNDGEKLKKMIGKPVGSEGRKVSVTTEIAEVAEELRKTFEAKDRSRSPLFLDVTVEEVTDEAAN